MGISPMWSDGRHLEGVFSGYDDSFVLLKMPGGGKCVFNSDWVLDSAYKDWLQVVKGDKHAASCKLCCREFKLASMGKAALTSHMEGARHQRRVRDSAKSVSIARSFASVEETSQVAPTTFTNDSVMEGTGEGRAVQSLSDLCMLSKNVADAEILWALKCVSSHFSGSSNTGVNDLFKRMLNTFLKSTNCSRILQLDGTTMSNTLVWIYFHLNSVTTGRLYISLLNNLNL